MKEKLEEYALIAEIVSAIAIVASLVFVGVQIQHNSRISQVNAYQELSTQIMNLNVVNAANKDLSELVYKAIQGQKVNEVETFRLTQVFIPVIRHGDMAFLQYQQGYITKAQFDGTLGPFRAVMNAPVFKHSWEVMKPNVNPLFVNYMESNLFSRNSKQ